MSYHCSITTPCSVRTLTFQICQSKSHLNMSYHCSITTPCTRIKWTCHTTVVLQLRVACVPLPFKSAKVNPTSTTRIKWTCHTTVVLQLRVACVPLPFKSAKVNPTSTTRIKWTCHATVVLQLRVACVPLPFKSAKVNPTSTTRINLQSFCWCCYCYCLVFSSGGFLSIIFNSNIIPSSLNALINALLVSSVALG